MEWVKILADYGISGVLAIAIIYLIKNMKTSNNKPDNNNISKIEKITDQNIEIDKKMDKVLTCLEYNTQELRDLITEIKEYTKETSITNRKLELLIDKLGGKS